MNTIVKLLGLVLFVYAGYMLFTGGLDYGQMVMAFLGFCLGMIDFDRNRR